MFKSIDGGILPQRATRYSAGFDVFANDDIVIGAGETKLIGLGICIDAGAIQDMLYAKSTGSFDFACTHYLELHPRSSIRAKGIGGGVGIIDWDYRDEIKMVITNSLKTSLLSTGYGEKKLGIDIYNSLEIKRGDKIGQLLLKRHDGWLLPDEYTKQTQTT